MDQQRQMEITAALIRLAQSLSHITDETARLHTQREFVLLLEVLHRSGAVDTTLWNGRR